LVVEVVVHIMLVVQMVEVEVVAVVAESSPVDFPEVVAEAQALAHPD
jgi:hypothetical protein